MQDKYNLTKEQALFLAKRNIVDNIYSIIQEKYYNIEDDKLIWESYYTLSDCLTFFKKIGGVFHPPIFMKVKKLKIWKKVSPSALTRRFR